MSHLQITGLKPYDGRYNFELESFTTREWGWIKRLAGYLPMSLDGDALMDPEMLCVLAVIAMHRAGRIQTSEVNDLWERLQDVPPETTITIELDDESVEDDAGPPAQSSNGNSPTSGAASTTSSETSEPIRPVSGIPGSATSAPGRPTSVT